MSGPLVRWLAAFLQGRSFQATVGSAFSPTVHVSRGVPQGSPLSPVLFALFTADMFTTVKRLPFANIVGYADDVTLMAVGTTPVVATAHAQAQLSVILDWSLFWQQKFNPGKSQALVVARRHVPVHLTIGGEAIPQFPVIRVLGLHIDRSLTFRQHVNLVVRRSRPAVAFLRRLSRPRVLNVRWLRSVYFALVRSRLAYCAPVLESIAPGHLQHLEVVQRNCLRSLLGVRLRDRVSANLLSRRTKVPPLSAFLRRTNRRYIERAIRFALPVREAIEHVRRQPIFLRKTPAAVLNMFLPDEPLPPPA